MKEYTKMYNLNLLYLIFRNVNGYFEEINKSKYLTLVPNDESKEQIKELWSKIRDLIRWITKDLDDYYEKHTMMSYL